MNFKNQILNEDFFKVCEEIPDETFDFCITDPPYGDIVDGEFDLKIYKKSLPYIYDLMKPDTFTVLFCSPSFMNEVLYVAESSGFDYLWTFITYYPNKFNQKPHPLGDRRYDMALLFGKGEPQKASSILDVTIVKRDEDDVKHRDHPHSLPEEIGINLIKATTHKGDLILDPFCGTGVFCCSAKQLGRVYIGIELNKEYCEVAVEKLNEIDTIL